MKLAAAILPALGLLLMGGQHAARADARNDTSLMMQCALASTDSQKDACLDRLKGAATNAAKSVVNRVTGQSGGSSDNGDGGGGDENSTPAQTTCSSDDQSGCDLPQTVAHQVVNGLDDANKSEDPGQQKVNQHFIDQARDSIGDGSGAQSVPAPDPSSSPPDGN